jgi:uncharacterized protein (TIGR00369 family)
MKPPIPWPAKVPFVQSLGTEMVACGDGLCELQLALVDQHMNGREVAHGGVVMTLLDVAMAFAARSLAEDNSALATIEMKTTFMRPAERALRAVGKVLHKTRSMAFCEAHMVDAEGTLVAHASGTFKYIRPRSPAAKASVPNNPNQDSA